MLAMAFSFFSFFLLAWAPERQWRMVGHPLSVRVIDMFVHTCETFSSSTKDGCTEMVQKRF